jgi:5-methyltetrahydrofolate--homocysteine methyltransferase
VYVLDASRSVTVVSDLLGDKRDQFIEDIKNEYEGVRVNYAKKKGFKKFLSINEARANKFQIDWKPSDLKKPNLVGVKVLADYDLAELREYIDWTPFFHTWELRGKYPEILTHELMGNEASKLFKDANTMLDQIIAEKWLIAKASVGIWPANTINDDDIEIYSDETRSNLLYTQRGLRQQLKKADTASNVCLADFIAPKESGFKDYIGGFVVTTGLGIEKKLAEFEADHDDYHSILLKALADRLAEAFAEHLHELVRTDYWGYDQTPLDKTELIQEKYRGIRPAPGYPANPDHTEKPGLFELLNATELTGVSLTESMAMMPASSVSGWYFAHPQAHYFGVGKIKEDQVERLAMAKGISLARMKQWLSSNLED